jgi:ABC-2 type transport system ATP-binding protein
MLEARKISKAYHRKPILQDVDFTLEPGQLLGVAGHNGSGKSTLLSIIAQILLPDAGEVLYDGARMTGNRTLSSSILGYVPQENSLLEDLTVKETIEFWQKVYRLPMSKSFAPSSPAMMLGLDGIRRKRIAHLSGGMQKRVSIAIALMRQPRILLLDEALSSLDRSFRQALEHHLVDFCRLGGSILYCSHEINELIGFCGRILVLRQGKKVFDGETADFPTETAALDAILNP